jgi:sorting nexin-7/30/sorting nexin-8
VKGGVFSKSYVTYAIKTNPFDYKVCRRYSDFLWLRNILVREYPSYSVPPMCKKSGVSNTDMEGIHKRM